VENLLGQAGKGHQIAFNILNVGRYKLASSAIGGARNSLRDAIRYAKEPHRLREADILFRPGAGKIAQSAAEIYATEAVCIASLAQSMRLSLDSIRNSPTFTQDVQKRIEEFAVECSILKVFGSEMAGAGG